MGASICRLLGIDGLEVRLSGGLDAFDGTPVLDIEPVTAEFVPDGELLCPEKAADRP